MTPVDWLVVATGLLFWGVGVLAIWTNELRKRVKRLESRTREELPLRRGAGGQSTG